MIATCHAGYELDDFGSISTISGTQMVIVAKAEKGWENMSDVIAAAKSGVEISFGSMTQRLADGAHYIGKVNDVNFNIVSSYTGCRAVLNAITADDIDIGYVAGIQKPGVESGDLVNLVNAEDQQLAVSPDIQTLKDIGVDFYFGATVVVAAPAGLPEDSMTAFTDAIKTMVQKPVTKSNEYISKVFSQKTKTGDEVRAFIEQELADSKKLLEATSN